MRECVSVCVCVLREMVYVLRECASVCVEREGYYVWYMLTHHL